MPRKRKIRRLPERKDEFLALYRQGLNRPQMAEAMGVTTARIGRWLVKLGLNMRHAQHLPRKPCNVCGAIRTVTQSRRRKVAVCLDCDSLMRQLTKEAQ